MLEYSKLTVLELYLGDLIGYLHETDLGVIDKEMEIDKEIDFLDSEAVYGLFTFDSVKDFESRSPLCYGVVAGNIPLTGIDKIHIYC